MKVGQGKQVMIIDDDDHLRRTVTDLLVANGFESIEAASAEEALHLLHRHDPDLIILDIAMPGMGGVGFLRRITPKDGTPTHPVLVFTVRAYMQQFFDTIGVAGFVAKPCKGSVLLREVCKIMDRKEAEEARRRQHGRKVLIAEDDRQVMDDLVTTFGNAGYRIATVTSGLQLIEMAPTAHADIILIKKQLPEMEGDAVASLLAAMPSTHSIPVVLYDSSGEEGPTRLPDGVSRFLTSASSSDVLAASDSLTGKPRHMTRVG